MSRLNSFILVAVFTFSFVSSSVNASNTPVLLLSIDGFANDYFDDFSPPNLLSLANSGVKAKSLKSVFPSKTFPNHLSIVTGVYPVKHGIVHNYYYHRELKQKYRLGEGKNNTAWLTAKPIWVKAQEAGIDSAVYFWPESEAVYDGVSPTHFFPYKHNTPNEDRLNQVIEWLKLPEKERPKFIASYFSTIDSAGHWHGTKSTELKSEIKILDDMLGRFLNRVKQDVGIEIDIIIVSDHGMTLTAKDKNIPWSHQFSDLNDVVVTNGQTQLYVYSDNKTSLDTIEQRFKKQLLTYSDSPYTVERNGAYPAHWHFNATTPAVPDLVVNAHPPYKFQSTSIQSDIAIHGYDPQLTKDLDAIFIAAGPSFKQGKTINSFENVNVYSLLAYLLGIKQSENIDGKLTPFLEVLNK